MLPSPFLIRECLRDKIWSGLILMTQLLAWELAPNWCSTKLCSIIGQVNHPALRRGWLEWRGLKWEVGTGGAAARVSPGDRAPGSPVQSRPVQIHRKSCACSLQKRLTLRAGCRVLLERGPEGYEGPPDSLLWRSLTPPGGSHPSKTATRGLPGTGLGIPQG